MNENESQYRFDLLQKRWVIIAGGRGKRPDDFTSRKEPTPENGFCPFCPGGEGKTPREIAAVREKGSSADGPGWKIRVVANKFPALRIEGEANREADGIYDRMNGIGAHEVFIESPRHDSTIAERTVEDVAQLLQVFRGRLQDLMNDTRLKYILVFKNHGAAAGATLAHPHSQLIATTVTPRTIALELNACREHHMVKERCLICDIIKHEISERDRLIGVDERFVAFCPYASRFPFEAFIAPRFHQHDFALATDGDLRGLAASLREVLARLKRGLDDPPYNFVLHTAPNARVEPKRAHQWETLAQDFHWHMEILPRLTRVAGFEWGSGFYINPTEPEEAARFLRSV